ncbi:MAG: hypothetical protein KDD69_15855 [Bdellovibrionales bacterium]|nr:hypothetical protein [Bdellovibrionales bacterium]
MQSPNLFLLFTAPLDDVGIPYMVTGSVAAIVYGEPRLTHDIDLVVSLREDMLPSFYQSFPEDRFYVPPEEVLRVEMTRRQRGHVNLIHFETGFKADVYFPGEERLIHWGLDNRKTYRLDERTITVAPLEYVLVKKLSFFREGGSQKHVEDIRNMIRLSGEEIDTGVLEDHLSDAGLLDAWRVICPTT